MISMLRRWVKPLVGIVMTATFLWFLLRDLDISTLGAAFGRLSLPFLLLALAFLSAGYTVRIVRWWFMLRALEPSLGLSACVWPFLTSIAVNNVLPLRAGDALRVFGFRQQLSSPAMRVLGTLVIERLLDLSVLLAFFFVGLLGLPAGVFPESFVMLATWLAGGSVASLLTLIFVSPNFGDLVRWVAARQVLLKRGWSGTVSRLGSHLVDALALLRSPSRALSLFGLSIIAWALEGAVFATIAVALDSRAGTLGPWFALSTGTLATLLPSSPGYIGTFDYFAAKGLATFGAAPETATAFALTVHAVLWVPLTAAGLVYLLTRGRRLWTRRAPLEAATAKE